MAFLEATRILCLKQGCRRDRAATGAQEETMAKKPPARPAKPSRARSSVNAAKAEAPARRAARRHPAAKKAPPAEPATGAAESASNAGAGGHEAPLPDFNLLSRNLAQMIGEGGKVLAAYFRPLENGDFGQPGEDIARMAATLGRIAEYYLSDAQRALAAQATLSRQFLDLWASTLRRLQGEAAPPVAAPDPGDKRFDHPEWRDNPYFDFLKQAYVLTTRWAKDLVE